LFEVAELDQVLEKPYAGGLVYGERVDQFGRQHAPSVVARDELHYGESLSGNLVIAANSAM
jgi:hypothetical protein